MFYTIQSVAPPCQQLKVQGSKLVLATGFFDLLHAEHITFLTKAKAVGDILIVGVESDQRAREIKGEGRPVEPQSVRCHKVSAHADYVIALTDNFDNQIAYESLISTVKPDIYAVSSHTSFLENKKALIEKYGGKLTIVHAWNPLVSTTLTLKKN